MLKRLAQRVGALSVAAVLSLALAACGGGEAPSNDSSKPPATEGSEVSADVDYRCTKEGCTKTKKAAKGAPAPS